MKQMKTMSFQLENDLINKLKEQAKKEERTQKVIVTNALKQYFESYEKQE